MTVLYLVSDGVPERQQILGEVPLRRCIEEFGLDPAQRVFGLREPSAPFAAEVLPAPGPERGQQVVAGVGADEAFDGFAPGYYWLDLSPAEARRRLGVV